MKIFLATLLFVTGFGLAAQPVVLSRKGVAAKGLALKLDQEYKNPEGAQFDTPFSIQKAFQDMYEQMLDKDKLKDVTIWNTLRLNAEGKIDYLVFEILTQRFRVVNGNPQQGPDNADSLAAIISSKITPYLTGIISRRTAGSKATIVAFVGFQPRAPKEPQARKDSVVHGMAEALATKDTLKVKTLALSQSLLTAIPEVVYRFPNLEELLLNDNDIENVNLDMSRLLKLRNLDLSRNIVSENRIAISKNKSLRLLNLQMNVVRDIPPAARNCKKLEMLWLGNNRLTGLNNASFRKLKSVKDLNLYKGDVAVLPSGIRKMRRLEVLDLYYNKLEILPKSITKLKRLTHFAVSHNQINALPARIDRMKRVHTLYAHHNHLSKLPERMKRMKELRIVDLGFNWLTTFPTELVAFTNLQELDLSANNFPDFPVQLLQIRKLDKLHLRGNPFLGADAERKYSDQLSQLKKKNIEVFY
ncbi:leucine-rich repeat domain-containing protein [Dyadobacter sp. CY261]|uniref:leucine-rich repeat domain-containing protein n=1 Tax=Dyadobacter sp. CY261 TaxID=2907203 RepID=UPI001F428950|nr:leucine-rich repeat domain-containing protein [Dyadobacter sp. CY261]MCF0073127.1 leucine-rich repeat domain-containing protein [Dyadobacter sp. CY261]